MSHPAFPIGSVVKVKAQFARSAAHRTDTYTVVKHNPRTLGLKNDRSGGKLNADPEVMVLAGAEDASAKPEVTTVPLVTTIEAPIPMGTVVTAGRGLRGVGPKDLLVVIGHVWPRGTYEATYRLCRLGGVDGTRYFTGVPKGHLTTLTLEETATALLDTL